MPEQVGDISVQEEKPEYQEKEPEEDESSTESDDPSLELEEERPEKEPEDDIPSAKSDDPSLELEEEQPEKEPEDDDLMEGESSQRHGCVAGCLVPIIVAFAVVLVILMIGYSKRDSISQSLLKRIVANTQSDVLNDLPIDMDPAQTRAEFEELKLARGKGQVDEEALTEIMEDYWDAVRQKPSPQERKQAIIELMANLKKVIMPQNQ